MDVSIVMLVFSMASFGLSHAHAATFNVMNFGAVGNGQTDDSQAFLRAWNKACQAPPSTPATLLVPGKRTFLLEPLTFNGPCKSSTINFQLVGNIVAPNKQSAWKGHQVNTWVVFAQVNGLVLNGGGQIDGQGSAWWSPSCANQDGGCKGPTALTYQKCNNIRHSGLTHINSQRNHITLDGCNRVVISNLRIIAPTTSPNTDGIDISGSTKVEILNSFIGTGDDCIAISGGSSSIFISGIACGPGHGISIGALGRGGFDAVENIVVRNSTMTGTQNGVRIKTWQGGSGYARNITFKGIRLKAVENPIIVDQFYCPNKVNCQNKTTAVKVSDVTYRGISGTSTINEVINLSCSQALGCTNIVFDHVHIRSAVSGGKPYASCFNAHGTATHTKPIVRCLSKH